MQRKLQTHVNNMLQYTPQTAPSQAAPFKLHQCNGAVHPSCCLPNHAALVCLLVDVYGCHGLSRHDYIAVVWDGDEHLLRQRDRDHPASTLGQGSRSRGMVTCMRCILCFCTLLRLGARVPVRLGTWLPTPCVASELAVCVRTLWRMLSRCSCPYFWCLGLIICFKMGEQKCFIKKTPGVWRWQEHPLRHSDQGWHGKRYAHFTYHCLPA